MPGLMELIWPGAFVVQSIRVVARLGVADLLGAEPRTADELAEAAQAHGPALRRVLPAPTLGVFAEEAEARSGTRTWRTPRGDHPESVRAWT